MDCNCPYDRTNNVIMEIKMKRPITSSICGNEYEIHGIFPYPVYVTKRDSNLDATEEKEIEDVKKEMNHNEFNSISANTYIFNTKLKKIKEFCERHIKMYVEEIINPKEGLADFYITQSWLNITKPDEHHQVHNHQNSIVSGVFYVSTVEDDKIYFYDNDGLTKNRIEFENKGFNIWNSSSWFFTIEKNDLILFPSWMTHSVEPNPNATGDRISLAFNVFAKGMRGGEGKVNALIL